MKHLLAIALLCAATTASAQPAQPKTAEEHYEASKALYNIEKYDEAIAELKLAYELARDPTYLFNIAQAMRKKNDCAGALDYYRKYLRDSPAAPNRAKVEQWMTEMEACAKTQLKAPPELPDPEPVAPITTPIAPKPLVPQPVQVKPAPMPPRRAGKGLKLAGVGTAAAGGAIVVVGGLLALSARNISSDIETRCALGCDWASLKDRDATGRERATLSRVSFAVGGAAVIGGAVMFVLGRAKGRESPVAIVPTGDGAMVTVHWSR